MAGPGSLDGESDGTLCSGKPSKPASRPLEDQSQGSGGSVKTHGSLEGLDWQKRDFQAPVPAMRLGGLCPAI